ncbi:MAG: arginine--tRNA ligase [Candidatus Thermoplasmatota archaeon]|nr:arginine--tRNA ligase [Candidatus Thermoplasmatota archaeon]
MQAMIDAVIPALGDAMSTVGVKGDFWRNMLGRSKESSQGDLALPCFPFAKQLDCSPNEAASRIADALELDIGEAVAVGPYVNIRASLSWLSNQINREPQSKGSILIEHTSANPNGPFHVGRARNAVLGDTFVRMHRAAGYDVTAEYYVDDMGKQVGILCWALENLDHERVHALLDEGGISSETSPHSEKQDHARVLWYQAANILKAQDATVDSGVTELVQLSEEANADVLNRFESSYQPVLDGMLQTLGRMGINFDSFTKESRFIVDGSVEIVMEKLQSSELHGVAENGAHYLELESKGVKGKSTQFFYRRGDGSSLYATRDLAYHQYKWTQSDRLLNILGEDHKLQSRQVGIALDELGIQPPEVVFYAFTKLADGKMSTRRGNVVYMDDLLDEAQARALETVRESKPDLSEEKLVEIAEAVGISATRFNIARISPEKGITFRWSDALSLEADSAPFIMYSYARACSIQRKAGVVDAAFEFDPNLLEGSAAALIRRLAYMDDELQTAIDSRSPHNFCAWLSALAVDYNRFYRDNYVIDDDGVNAQNLYISELAREHIRRGCEAVGIIPIEEM